MVRSIYNEGRESAIESRRLIKFWPRELQKRLEDHPQLSFTSRVMNKESIDLSQKPSSWFLPLRLRDP